MVWLTYTQLTAGFFNKNITCFKFIFCFFVSHGVSFLKLLKKKIGRGGLEFIISLSKLWHMYNGVKTSRLLLNPGFATNCTRKFISKKSHKKWINFIYIWNIDIMPPYSDLLQNTIKIPASFFQCISLNISTSPHLISYIIFIFISCWI